MLVDDVRRKSINTQERLEAFLEEQKDGQAKVEVRLGQLETKANTMVSKTEELSNSMVEVTDDISNVRGQAARLNKSIESIEKVNQAAKEDRNNLLKNLNGLTERFDSEMSDIAGTLSSAKDMQGILSEEMAKMSKAAEASENIMGDLRAEQAAGIKALEHRFDRMDQVMALKATATDVIYMLGSKADRGVIDKLADERTKLLKNVSNQLHEAPGESSG